MFTTSISSDHRSLLVRLGSPIPSEQLLHLDSYFTTPCHSSGLLDALRTSMYRRVISGRTVYHGLGHECLCPPNPTLPDSARVAFVPPSPRPPGSRQPGFESSCSSSRLKKKPKRVPWIVKPLGNNWAKRVVIKMMMMMTKTRLTVSQRRRYYKYGFL